ncbi:MAG: hypothetical protein HND40_09860 [Ignavibacteriota bacterium]|mgnify:CR=1 FL=1|nr:MAG: hypothetical protein F9K42_12760 [Ignavibacterium sp.]MBL1153898.1 hypothetical protein [Ignavibacteriota bacterium]MCO6447824.1 hypothetical protein [Ignavibacterium album]MCZ2269244.1 hypothetical protein [Ignavibacteriales bacterium]MDX9711154.1 hypothetical protein [Ignavibacteriaceae bacterium]
MNIKKKCRYLCSASLIIFMFGLIRGIGGLIAMINSSEILIDINYSFIILILLIITCIALSAASVIVAIALFEQDRNYIFYGVLLLLTYIIYSLIQDYFILNKFISNSSVINLVAAGIAISLLLIGKKHLNKP